MSSGIRLRQVALVARDGDRVAAQLREQFGWPEPFHDPGVAEFGLRNSVFEVGDTFIEIVTPATDDTAAGRYLDRLGGDGGYMAIFQVSNMDIARDRLSSLGVREVWSVDLADMATSHIHPKDTPGAIVSLDWADPAGSWRWAGPRWAGTVPENVGDARIAGITIEVDDPASAARRWAEVLAIPLAGDATGIEIGGTGQVVNFVTPARTGARGIIEVAVSGLGCRESVVIGGVRFVEGGKS